MIRALLTFSLCAALACAHAQAPSTAPPARVEELPARQLGPSQRAELRRNVMAEQGRKARQAPQDETPAAVPPRQLDALQRAQLRAQLREQSGSQRGEASRGGPQGNSQGGPQDGRQVGKR